MISGYMKLDLDLKKRSKEKHRYFVVNQSPTWELIPLCVACSHGGRHSGNFLDRIDDHNRDDKRKPQREATGATAAPTPTGHITAYLGGGAAKQTMTVARPFFQSVRSVKRQDNRAAEPKHGGCAQDLDSCIVVAGSCLAFYGSLRPP